MFDNDRFAALLCDWCLEPEPGDRILITTETIAEPAVAALEAALLERGAWPFARLIPAGQTERILEHGQERHYGDYNPFDAALNATLDTVMRIEAPTNTRAQAAADPVRLAQLGAQSARLRELRGDKRWAVSIWPTPALAQEADMGLAAYERFLAAAMFLDQPDPVAAWRELDTRQQALVDRLASARQVRILSEQTDITMEVTDRTWRNSSGRRNMPSGEVFTSPLESSANGHILFDVSSNSGGVNVGQIALTFVDGVITEAHAEVGDARLQAQLDSDAGARRLGEIGIGTNFGIDRATGSTLLDEKIGGTIHLALGRSYTECGGLNESAIHWDIVCDLRSGGEIVVDGEVLSRDGRFL